MPQTWNYIRKVQCIHWWTDGLQTGGKWSWGTISKSFSITNTTQKPCCVLLVKPSDGDGTSSKVRMCGVRKFSFTIFSYTFQYSSSLCGLVFFTSVWCFSIQRTFGRVWKHHRLASTLKTQTFVESGARTFLHFINLNWALWSIRRNLKCCGKRSSSAIPCLHSSLFHLPLAGTKISP